MREVEVARLCALPSLSADELNARLANQRDIEPAVWLIAQAREAIIRDIIADSGSTETKVRDAAETLGLSARSVYRLLARYRTAAQTTSLTPQSRGRHKKRRRLGMIRERRAVSHAYHARNARGEGGRGGTAADRTTYPCCDRDGEYRILVGPRFRAHPARLPRRALREVHVQPLAA